MATASGETRLRPWAFPIVRFLLGGLLLVAAGLKIYGFTLDPFAEGSVLASARLQVAAVEIEVLLGMWLLTGWWPRWAWASALALFSTFAAVSLYLALAGQASCSCFGKLAAVSPWVTFGVDVAALTALLLWRPARGEVVSGPVQAHPLLKVGVGVCVLLALVSGVALLNFASPMDALAWLRGESITVGPPVRDVGKGLRGEARTFRADLTNRTQQPIRIVGGTTDCACITTKDLPVELAPGETQAIEVSVKFAGSPGRFQRLYVLMTDDRKQPTVYAVFRRSTRPGRGMSNTGCASRVERRRHPEQPPGLSTRDTRSPLWRDVMSKLIRTTAARLFEEAHTCLSILGVVLLTLSVLAAPSDGLLADTGGGSPVPRAACIAMDGCEDKNYPCEKTTGGTCSSGINVCNKAAGCNGCPCTGCYSGIYFCDCYCSNSTGSCSGSNKCI